MPHAVAAERLTQKALLLTNELDGCLLPPSDSPGNDHKGEGTCFPGHKARHWSDARQGAGSPWEDEHPRLRGPGPAEGLLGELEICP